MMETGFDRDARERVNCGPLHCDNGTEPKGFRKTGARHKDHRKTMQLCRQVERTLSFVIAGEGRDEVLQGLYVLSVEPAPDASRLLVNVGADVVQECLDRGLILARLDAHLGRLRCEVARSITRKKVPVLVFNVIGGREVGSGR